MVTIPVDYLVQAITIILSIVALLVTVIGFFASLKFYRDGKEAQTSANNALARIEEKSRTMQNQVESMFDKTLDAAIGENRVRTELGVLQEQVQAATPSIVELVTQEVGEAGAKEREHLASEVQKHMDSIRERINEARDSLVDVVDTGRPIVHRPTARMGKVLAVLSAAEIPMTAADIAASTGMLLQHAHPVLVSLANQGVVIGRPQVGGEFLYNVTPDWRRSAWGKPEGT